MESQRKAPCFQQDRLHHGNFRFRQSGHKCVRLENNAHQMVCTAVEGSRGKQATFHVLAGSQHPPLRMELLASMHPRGVAATVDTQVENRRVRNRRSAQHRIHTILSTSESIKPR